MTKHTKSMRTFTLVWLGQLISTLGGSLTSFALAVYVVEQTGNATPFALTVLFASLPRVALAPVAGSLIDRLPRRWVMIGADIGAALASVALVALLLLGELQVWHIYIMTFTMGIFDTFQRPAYMAAISMMVPKEQLGRASGMVQTAQGMAQLVAPVAAGVLFVAIGLRGIVLIDFISFFFAIGTLLVVRIPEPEKDPTETERPTIWQDAKLGLRYIVQRKGLMAMLVYFSLINFFANFSAVLSTPMILSTEGPEVLGVVQAVSGAGMLAGSLLMGAWGGFKPGHRMRGVYGFMALFSVGFIVMGLAPSPWLYGAGFALVMFGIPLGSGHSQPIWQTKVAPNVQGRVFATRQAVGQLLMPVAFLIAGPLADGIFEPAMQPGGALAQLGWLVGGTGDGRGIALLFMLSGIMLLIVTVGAIAYKPLREVEDTLPDHTPNVHAVPATQ